MHLGRIELSDLPPITRLIKLEFNERVNVLIGPNASGKSTILMKLANILNGLEDNSKQLIGSIGVSADWLTREGKPVMGGPDSPPAIHIPAVRAGLPGLSNEESLKDLLGTGAEVLAGPFSASSATLAFNLLDKELSQDETTERSFNLSEAINVAHDCGKQICNGVIRSEGGPKDFIHGWVSPRQSRTGSNFISRLMEGVITTDTPNYDHTPESQRPVHLYGDDRTQFLHLSQLSSGTQGTLLWIWWLALKMVHHYNFAEDFHEKPAILLIDEIENHLHPTWQRRVIPELLKHFPGLQIFATTHSPFVVAGLEAGQVHLLQRDAEGVVTASTNERDVIGWTADEILRTLMGVDEPTDQLTVNRANRVRELREKETLTPEEESELQEKRRQVNRDLLAKSGPLEAQRERYADLMRNFLLSRQSDLTQDGE